MGVAGIRMHGVFWRVCFRVRHVLYFESASSCGWGGGRASVVGDVRDLHGPHQLGIRSYDGDHRLLF